MAAAGVLSPDATVIALSAFPDEDTRRASVRLGAAHFLEKPVSLELLSELAAGAGVSTAMRLVQRDPGVPLLTEAATLAM